MIGSGVVRLRVFAIVIALGFLSAACTPAPEPPDPTTPVRPTTSTIVASETASSAACTLEFPSAQPLLPETLEELVTKDGFSLCANLARTAVLLDNKSKVPWVVDKPSRPQARLASSTISAQSLAFREMLGTRRTSGVVVEPGGAMIVTAAPEDLHFILDVRVTSLWRSIDLFADFVQSQARETVADAISHNSPMRNAVTSCGLAAYDAWEFFPEASQTQSQDPTKFMLDRMGLIDQAKACGQTVDEASKAQKAPRTQITRNSLLAHADNAATGGWRSITNKGLTAALKFSPR